MARRILILAGLLVLGALVVLVPLWRGPAVSGVPAADRALPPLALAEGAGLRLGVMGTSLTATYDWPERAAEGLADCLGRPVQLERFAKAGENILWGMTQIDTVIAAAPDILLIEFVINDADLRDGVALGRSQDLHSEMLGRLTAALPETRIVLVTMSPVERMRGILRPRLGAYYRSYALLSEAQDVGFLDLYSRWLELPRDLRGLERDGLHPDPGVTRAVVLPALLPYLGRLAGAPDCHYSGEVPPAP